MDGISVLTALLALAAAASCADASRSIIAEGDRTCTTAPWRVHEVRQLDQPV